jgi:hypothetical protein
VLQGVFFLSFKTFIMSINSFTGLMSSYSPLADRSPSSEDEKDIHARLQPDVEVGNRQDGSERKSSRFIDGRTVSDAIIGLSDGMTVPFALTAGLSALGDTKVVVFGGLAELIAGAISMGLGGYLGAKSEEYVFSNFFTSTGVPRYIARYDCQDQSLTYLQGVIQGYIAGNQNTNNGRSRLDF